MVLHAIELIILSLLAGAFHHRAAVSLLGRCIPSPRRRFFARPVHSIAAPWSFRSAGESHRRAAFSLSGRRISSSCHNLFVCRRIRRQSTNVVLSHFGRRIPSPRHHCLSRLAHPIAHIGRRIPSPRHHCLSWLAHPIAYLLCLALIAPEQAAYCADSTTANPGYPLLLLIVAF